MKPNHLVSSYQLTPYPYAAAAAAYLCDAAARLPTPLPSADSVCLCHRGRGPARPEALLFRGCDFFGVWGEALLADLATLFMLAVLLASHSTISVSTN